jgi:two-component system sensor histidine kinase BaeS
MAIDPERLDQALGNLLSNAIKFTPKDGGINVVAGFEDHTVLISVHDTGAGIDQNELGEIFTPFYRGPQGRRFPQGMGLGLSIACDIVVAHGGKIEVQSSPGEGSEFTIHLPLDRE